MAKKRTKQAKLKAKDRRSLLPIPGEAVVSELRAATPSPVEEPSQLASLFNYPVQYIYQDLLQTLGTTSAVMVLLGVLSFYLR